MSKIKYPHLFAPIQLCNTIFRNRIFGAPTGALDLTPDGFPVPDTCAYYEMKAMGGAANITVGQCIVDAKRGMGASNNFAFDNPLNLPSMSALANAISRHGAVASAELQHAGMFALRSHAKGAPLYGPVACVNSYGLEVEEMPVDVILETIEAYGNAAAWAKKCGFGMVLIHGGHGWMLSQFISSKTNTRKDKWGGNSENRMRLPLAVVENIRKKAGPDFPIEFRISGSECNPNGYDIDEGIAIAKMLDGKVDLIHVSAGNHEVPEAFVITHPTMFLPDGCNVKYAAEIKKHVKTPVATVGALADPALMEEIIASGQADVVEVARGLIADPDLPRKARTGKEDEIKLCMRCLACFSNLMNTGHFSCAINPVIGHETDLRLEIPVAEKKKVLVVGGGIGGMQAALTAAERGHKVILCEKKGRLGGVLRCEEKVPFKKKLGDYLDNQVRMISRAPIDVHLNTEVTPELAFEIGADVIIAALGSRPIKPDIPGIDGANVIGAVEVYGDAEKVGKKVIVLGGGLVGVELGIYLRQLSRDVTIVEMLPELNFGENFMHGRGLGFQIKDNDIKTILSTKAVEINEKGAVCEGPEGKIVLEADTLVYAVGQQPLWEETNALRFCAPEFHQIGDCLVPKNIQAATSAAFHIARDIGRK
jgi:2,4-dienoyl-CoA reductase-like NADH-dependent reductase (Old Yellow Enzyme family)/thioredoxin reductase